MAKARRNKLKRIITPKDSNQASRLTSRLTGLFTESVVQRVLLETEWLKDIRQYYGVYESNVLAQLQSREGASQEFMRATRTKTLTMDARIVDLDAGTGKKNWGIRPAHDPITAETEGQYDEPDDQGRAMRQVQDQNQHQKDALAAELMDEECQAQLLHTRHFDVMRRVIHSGHLMGCGVQKGPMVAQRTSKVWALGQRDQAGSANWSVIETDERTPYFEFVPLWDFYPEMWGRELGSTEYLHERHLLHKSDLLRMARRKGFNTRAILDRIQARPQGDSRWESWEAPLDAIGRYQANRAQTQRRTYEVLEYWGPADVAELRDLGADFPEELAGEVEINCWYFRSTGEAIAVFLNPYAKQDRPYSYYIPEPEEGHLFGVSVPSIMRDPQNLLNAAVRMTVDNAASAVGPQIEIDVSRVPTAKNLTSFRPFRMWAVDPDQFGQNVPAIRFNEMPNHTQQLLMLTQFLKTMGDENSGIPSYQYGQSTPGVGRTSSGLSMLMGAAGLLLKNQLNAFDEYMASTIQKLYDWNMQYNPKPDIKGHFKVHVTSSVSMALREQRAALLKDLRVSLGPQFMQWVKTRQWLWFELQENDIDPSILVKSKLELQQEMQAMAMQQQAQQAQAELAGGMPALPAPVGGPAGAPPPAPPSPQGGVPAPASPPSPAGMAKGGLAHEKYDPAIIHAMIQDLVPGADGVYR